MKTVIINCNMDYDLDELHDLIAQKLSFGKGYAATFDDLRARLLASSDEVMFVFENREIINGGEQQLWDFVEDLSKQNPNIRTINR